MRNYYIPALVISILFHTFLITGLPDKLYKTKEPDKKEEKTKSREISMLPVKIKKMTKPQNDLPQQKKPLPYVDDVMRDLVKNKSISPLEKPQILAKNTKKVVFSDTLHIEKSLKKNPAYMDYYRLIREKIRSYTYRYYQNEDNGEIFLNFVVLKDGQLQNLFLGPESVASLMLKENALQSVKDAAPFPPFPEELKTYTHLKFSISIYFKNN